MKVFKTCFIIIRRHAAAYILYFTIFVVLLIATTASSTDRFNTNFAAVKPNYTIINRDGDSPIARGLASYMESVGTEVPLEDDMEALQDAVFFHETSYIAILPPGFSQAFGNGEDVDIEVVRTSDEANGFYADSLFNQYLNQARLYRDSGIELETAAQAALDDLSHKVEVIKRDFNIGVPINDHLLTCFKLMGYMLMILIILCVSNYTKAFRRPDIRMRNLCAPLRSRGMNRSQIMCGLVISAAVWVLLNSVALLVYGSGLEGADGRIIALLLMDSLAFTIVSLSVASFASIIITSPSSQNAVANFIALGFSFLGGLFVPLELLGENVLSVAQFTPAYWYATALNHIRDLTDITSESLATIWQALLIQLAFAGTFFCITLVISKYVNQSERGFGSVQTILED